MGEGRDAFGRGERGRRAHGPAWAGPAMIMTNAAISGHPRGPIVEAFVLSKPAASLARLDQPPVSGR